MTEKEFLDKVKEMQEEANKLITEKAKKVIKSGVIDLESFENNYLLPKIFMSAMGKEIEWQFKPRSRSHIILRNNIFRVI